MTKTEMVRRMRRGEFGNTLRTWWSWEEFVRDAPGIIARYDEWKRDPGPYDAMFRMRTKVANGKFRPDITPYYLTPEDFETHYLGNAAPDGVRLIQGEFYDGNWADPGPYFLYSFARTHMVAALRDHPQQAQGERALAIIRHFMDAESWDNFQRLRNDFPDHVIEFTVFGCATGVLGLNTIFWEVRSY